MLKTQTSGPDAAKRIPEFAINNRISVRQAYRKIAEGRLRAVKRGSATLILPDDEEAWRRSLPEFVPGSGDKSTSAAVRKRSQANAAAA